MPNTEAQKKARTKWVENNREFYNALHNEYTKNYYNKHREERLAYAQYYRAKKKAEKSGQEFSLETLGETLGKV
jgi:hypothetical protein